MTNNDSGAGEPGLVSVIMPTFNRAYILAKAIESALAQTYSNIELVIIDDGSTDDTRSVVLGFDDPRVRYHYRPNGGMAAARNTGFRMARGEYLAFLDSDDTWFPWKIEAQVRVLERQPDVGMLWTDMTAVLENGTVVQERYLRTFYAPSYAKVRLEEVCEAAGTLADYWPAAPDSAAAAPVLRGDIYRYMFLGNLVHTSTALLRRDRLRKVGEFDESHRLAGEDYEFHLRTCSFGPVALLDVPTIRYRVASPDQITVEKGPRMVHLARANLHTVLWTLERDGGRLNFPPAVVRHRVAEAFWWVGAEELMRGARSSAARALWKSLRYEAAPRTAGFLLLTALPTPVLTAARRARARLRASA